MSVCTKTSGWPWHQLQRKPPGYHKHAVHVVISSHRLDYGYKLVSFTRMIAPRASQPFCRLYCANGFWKVPSTLLRNTPECASVSVHQTHHQTTTQHQACNVVFSELTSMWATLVGVAVMYRPCILSRLSRPLPCCPSCHIPTAGMTQETTHTLATSCVRMCSNLIFSGPIFYSRSMKAAAAFIFVFRIPMVFPPRRRVCRVQYSIM